MIFIGSKNRRLRLQLFLCFMLTIGSLPGGSEGLKCLGFECEDRHTTDPNCKKKATVCPGGACFKEETRTGDVVNTYYNCVDKKYAKCIQEAMAPGKKCFSVVNPYSAEVAKMSIDLEKRCPNPKGSSGSRTLNLGPRVGEGEEKTVLVSCVCYDDGCDPPTSNAPVVTKLRPPSSSAQKVPNFLLAILLLMAPPIYYRFFQGGMLAPF